MVERARLYKGDRDKLKRLDRESIDLVFTSPPYANARKHNCGDRIA